MPQAMSRLKKMVEKKNSKLHLIYKGQKMRILFYSIHIIQRTYPWWTQFIFQAEIFSILT